MTTGTRVVVGVDGGGTKTAACVMSLEGAVLAIAHGGAGNWELIGLPALEAALAGPVHDALTAAGLNPADVASIAWCLAGIDWPSDVPRVRPHLPALGDASVLITNDAFAALRAGLDDGVGIVSVAGTGGVTAGRNAAGDVWRTMGVSLGEAGGASGMVREAVQTIAREHHHQLPRSLLADRLVEAAGYESAAAWFEVMTRRRTRPDPELARVVLAAAVDDAVAAALVDRCARVHAADVRGAASALGMAEHRVRVVASGGLHSAGSAVFDDAFVAGLAPLDATVVRLQVPPVRGAALLALDRVR